MIETLAMLLGVSVTRPEALRPLSRPDSPPRPLPRRALQSRTHARDART